MVQKKNARSRSTNRRIPQRQSLWQESMTYLHETKRYIWVVIVLFFGASIVAYALPDLFTGFNSLIRELGGQIENLGQAELIWFILQNNVTSAFVGMVAGAVFGVMPVFNALVNGTLLGYVYALSSAEVGFGVIVYLIPHGIFELPAIFIALGLGIRTGMFLLAPKGEKAKEFRKRFWGSLKVFLTVVLPLLIIAAIIEGTLIAMQR